jgi:ribonuclease D
MLKKELLGKKRLLWVEEECDHLSRVRPAPPDDFPFFLKFKNARKLKPRSLAVLESILKFRDDWAMHKDRPPFKVLGNETIMEIAEKRPLKKQDLEDIKGLSPGLIKKIGPSILQKVTESLSLSEDQLPVFPKKTKSRISPKVSKGIKILRVWRRQRAKILDMDPAIICTNAQIEALARMFANNPEDLDNTDILRKWQKNLYGKEIYDVLDTEL